MRLSRKITLFLELGIVILVAIYAYTEISDDARTIRADVQSDLTAVARESAALLSTLDSRVAHATLERSFDPLAHVQVHWIEPDAETPQLAPGGEAVVETRHRMSVYRAFSDPTGHTAMLEVSRSTDDIDRLVRFAAIRSIVLVAVIVALGTLYSVFVGSRIIARPMRQLVARFRRVGAGDMTPIEGPRSNDEFGVLTNELDEMIRQLAHTREQRTREHVARLETLEQLQHAERLTTVGKLASGIAHELGTPLNVISGYARLIATGQETGQGAADSAKIIDEQTQRITKIVRQLLDFARRGMPKLAVVDVRATMSRALSLTAMLAKKAGVKIDYEEPAQAMSSPIDDGRIQQVIVNLVHNAIQASPSGASVTVALATQTATRPTDSKSGDYVRIDIVDHGSGIPEQDVHRVFEPFFTTKAVGEGTGLGLSVSHGIVEEHHGWIAIESELGKGSRFSVYLPAQHEASA